MTQRVTLHQVMKTWLSADLDRKGAEFAASNGDYERASDLFDCAREFEREALKLQERWTKQLG